MSTQSRRNPAAVAKRPAVSQNPAKPMPPNPGAASHQPKKRPALANLTNQAPAARAAAGNKVGPVKKIAPAQKRAPPVGNPATSNLLRPCSSAKLSPPPKKGFTVAEAKSGLVRLDDGIPSILAEPGLVLSPLDAATVSMDESMSTCESLNSPDVEYLDSGYSFAVASLERKTCNKLYISEAEAAAAKGEKEKGGVAVNLDDDYDDPQLCASFASDIYEHLHDVETRKRPSTDFMELIQKDINSSMRAILVDWLVEVAEEYRLVPDTLYLAVNYIDRYLSSNVMNRQRLQLLGVSSMLIAAKYEEISAPSVEEFCYITDNTYLREEVLEMESAVLRHLKFEMTAPTTKCFLRRFVRAAQESSNVSALQMDFLASYVAELSLLDYGMLCYAPSTIAASSIFLAKIMLLPRELPWNQTLVHYTSYKPSALCECVKALHRLVCNSEGSTLPAIRQKYCQHKYKAVATIPCPAAISSEFFQDL